MNTEDIIQQASTLPRSEQMALIEALQAQVDASFSAGEIEEAWLEEAHRRIAELRTNKIIPVLAEDVLADVRTRIDATDV